MSTYFLKPPTLQLSPSELTPRTGAALGKTPKGAASTRGPTIFVDTDHEEERASTSVNPASLPAVMTRSPTPKGPAAVPETAFVPSGSGSPRDIERGEQPPPASGGQNGLNGDGHGAANGLRGQVYEV